MNFYVENEADVEFPFDPQELVNQVALSALELFEVPYEVQINVLITDNEGIREYNRTYRDIDKETDVLSFPNLDFETEGVIEIEDAKCADYFDPDTDELILGDIILSKDRIYEQAESYGHSVKREFAFLVAHSMLHLLGFDHMVEEEARIMEAKQEEILAKLGITRD